MRLSEIEERLKRVVGVVDPEIITDFEAQDRADRVRKLPSLKPKERS